MGKKRGHNVNRKTKIHVVFDPEARRNFLLGFHTRKLQRKKEAKEKIEQQLKEEKKILKAKAKNAYRELIQSTTPVPQLEELHTEEIQLENQSVSIRELSTAEMLHENKWIGINQAGAETEASQNTTKPGMYQSKKELKKAMRKQTTSNTKKISKLQKKNQKGRKRQSEKNKGSKSNFKSKHKK